MNPLEKALADIAALQVRVSALESASGLFASAQDLDGQRGDPAIRFDPRAWKGQSFKGKRFSQCSPEYLDAVAEMHAWMAAHPKEGKEHYAKYDTADAARARGWARRLRAGWKPTAVGQFPGGSPGFEAPAFGSADFPDDAPFSDADEGYLP